MRRIQSGRSLIKISQNGEYFFRRAYESSHREGYRDALEYYNRALSTDPHCACAWHEKGNCLYELGRFEEALESYDEAIRHDPCDAENWYDKGVILKRVGREDEAYSCIHRGIDLSLGEKSHFTALFSLQPILISQICRFIRMLRLLTISIVKRGSRISRDIL
jgi:tetratricopeptide (TPR) repeat protein